MKKIYLILLFLLVNLSIRAQNEVKSTREIDLGHAKFVLIKLEGKIILENTNSQRMIINITSKKEGRIIGISNEKERKPYNVVSELKGSEMIVQPEQRKSFWAVGFSTYSEKNIHYLHIPSNLNIVIETHSADISVNGEFPFVEVNNKEGSTNISINGGDYKFIECESERGEVELNNNEHGRKLNLIGDGSSVVIAHSDKGKVDITLFK